MMACAVPIPLLLSLSGVDIPATSLLRMCLVMTAVTAVPLVLGMVLRAYAATTADRLETVLDKPAKLLFAAIVLATFWQNRSALADSATTVGPAVVLLNGVAVAAALATRYVSQVSPSQSRAIAIETGLQNAAIAIFLATSILARPELAVPALMYAVVMNITALAIVSAAKCVRYGPQEEAGSPGAIS